ncbi:MAG: F0F1 ATP synthase subunit B [Chloroflexota bacterium]|nr:F0F1 ATP synthase subunit B [Chloroflexota bacterium]
MLDHLVIATAAASEEGAEEGGGSFLVSPDIGLMIWTLVVFILSMIVLRKLAFPRIAEALDRRQRAIEESIESAERLKVEADQLIGEYRQRLTDARQQADEIVARARKTGEAAHAEAVAEARRKHDELLEQTRREIQVETQRAIQEIRSEVANMTVRATEKVTRKSLTDADQRRLVDEALSELDFAALSGPGGAR